MRVMKQNVKGSAMMPTGEIVNIIAAIAGVILVIVIVTTDR